MGNYSKTFFGFELLSKNQKIGLKLLSIFGISYKSLLKIYLVKWIKALIKCAWVAGSNPRRDK